ncbi:hypothetical protein [Streptococcus oricebi]|uniref:PTS transporter n=1 Tax=Streptococcus oricebi TaxID=1547447 RepID=A0ABS5B1Z2_9STRE|nr:hypothetical protein [Streptococcus oricebi]MBP2622845.1 hypothetical protein [Streptococcus oricebi]
MTGKERVALEAKSKAATLKNMYYARYLLVRYTLPIYFFVNLYWLLILFLSKSYLALPYPLVLMGAGGLAMLEQGRMYSEEQKPARLTSRFLQLTIISNLVLMLAVLGGAKSFFYPFVKDTSGTSAILIIFLGLGILLAGLILAKLRRIDAKADWQYKRIRQYLSAKS